MGTPKTFLLVASPGNQRSTSQALGGYLAGHLQASGAVLETGLLYPAVETEERFQALLARAASADLLVLAFPLYVDHLPAPLIRFLEGLHRLRASGGGSEADLAAIVNCGFPETLQCRPAADIVEHFACCSRYRFLGCLQLGMGGFVSGRDLERTGGLMRRQRRALQEAASALAEGRPIPAETVSRFGRPMMPRWLYAAVANWNFKRTARRHGAASRLLDRPFA